MHQSSYNKINKAMLILLTHVSIKNKVITFFPTISCCSPLNNYEPIISLPGNLLGIGTICYYVDYDKGHSIPNNASLSVVEMDSAITA